MVEHAAVNRRVAGSSPARGAFPRNDSISVSGHVLGLHSQVRTDGPLLHRHVGTSRTPVGVSQFRQDWVYDPPQTMGACISEVIHVETRCIVGRAESQEMEESRADRSAHSRGCDTVEHAAVIPTESGCRFESCSRSKAV